MLLDSRPVKLVRKILPLTLLSVSVLMGAGCTGINASHSVSPASFFLPGLIQVEPEYPVLPADQDAQPVLVAARLPKDVPTE